MVITKPQADGPQTPTYPPCLHHSILAQLLCLLVGHVDVVEATEEGGQDNHEDEHEPGRGWDGEGSEKVSTLGEVRFWEEGSGDGLPDSASLGKYSNLVIIKNRESKGLKGEVI